MGPTYRALVGINFPGPRKREIRVEPGEKVPTDLVERAPWLLEQQLVELVAGEEA